ncbi:uncharacterized protein DDB_G0271670-like [Lucilia sericata]|uniref:uncharacterized protein DDB_G0271670-like n=1 Tax=Lucilia sericata TaxID=13632 RepID=UPI0018A82337|nr:uncharacterized protein DDB_G0271670-like [Lucilia sericata]
MCPKNSKAPIFLIGGICFVIILVAICGITLINNINLSNIIRLNEKVASDSMSPNNHHEASQDYEDNASSHSNSHDKERLMAGDITNYEQNHPKNIYRYDKETGMMSNINVDNKQQQQQSFATPSTTSTLDSKAALRQTETVANVDSSAKGFWQNDKIITNERNIDSLQIQEINAIESSSSSSSSSTTTTSIIDNDLLNQVLDSTSLSTTPSTSTSSTSESSSLAALTPPSPFVLVISDKNTSMIDYEKRSHVVKV